VSTVVLREERRSAVVLRDGSNGVVVFGNHGNGLVLLRGSARAAVVVAGFVGPRGGKGDPGDSSTATGRVVVPFAFGDASPAAIFTPAANCTDVLARLVIDTPFDGVGAALKLGTGANAEALIAAAHNDPAQAAGYEAAPDASLAAGQPVLLTITPGAGATRGAGRVIFDAIAN